MTTAPEDEGRYAQAGGLLTEVLDGEAVVLVLEDRSLHRLDAVATIVWSELSHPATATDVAARMVQRFHGDADVITADVQRLLADLRATGLLTRSA